jgi:hypothetical protein
VAFTASCDPNNTQNNTEHDRFIETKISVNKSDVIDVDLPEMAGVYFDSIVTKVNYIRLETNDDCLIGQIYDIKKDSDILFIRDFATKKILLFSTEGKYIRTISHLGNGPGEYLNFSDFQLDTVNKRIYIMDGDSGDLLCYSYDDKYLFTTSLSGRYSNHFSFLNDSIVAIDAGYRVYEDSPDNVFYNLELYNIKSRESETGFFPYDSQIFKLRHADPLMSSYNSNHYAWELLGNKAYKITGDSLLLAYSFTSDSHYPRHFLGLTNKELREKRKEKTYTTLDRFIEMDDWFLASISIGDLTVSNFVKKDKSESYFDLSYLNVSNEHPVILPNIVALDGKTMCGWVDAVSAERMNFIPKETMDGLSVNDNPILIFYELKP